MDLRIGDIVRYVGYKTEYKLIRIGKSKRFGSVELTKIDPLKTNDQTKIGAIFPFTPLNKLEVVIRVSRHPLTNIFKDLDSEKISDTPTPPQSVPTPENYTPPNGATGIISGSYTNVSYLGLFEQIQALRSLESSTIFRSY